MSVRIDEAPGRRLLSVSGDAVRPRLSGDAFELFEVSGPVGSGPPPHAHGWDEGYLVLEGELVVGGDDGEHTLHAGDAVLVAAGSLHWYRIASPSTRLVVVTGGRLAGAFFADIDANAPGLPIGENLPRVIEVAKRNGLTSPLF
jgi:quercetin dioxygenase-like cupin family protein